MSLMDPFLVRPNFNLGKKNEILMELPSLVRNIVIQEIYPKIRKFCMYYLQHERPCCIGRYKLEPKASVVNGLKNSSSYEPTGEKSLEIDEVYAEKIKVKVYANRQNSVSQYTDID